MLGQGEVRGDLEELHLLDARRLVLACVDHAVLDRVVDLVIGDHGRRHAGCREGAAPDRRALDADLEALQLVHVADRLVDEDVAGAAARIADQHDVGALGDLVGDRLQEVLVEHLVPVREVAEQERRVDERSRLGEGRHVRRRHDREVDRAALRHVLEVLLLEAELAVLVQDDVDRPVGAGLDEVAEPGERLGEGVVVVELRGPVELDRLLRVNGGRPEGQPETQKACGPDIPHGGSSLSALWRGRRAILQEGAELFNGSPAKRPKNPVCAHGARRKPARWRLEAW